MDLMRESDPMDEGKGRTIAPSVCSICLEGVVENKGRSIAKLHCNHEFHLDCIGSAFNVKGVMQCPNCRKVEKGQWLFANGARSCPEFSLEDWANDEDLYDPSYTEIPLGLQWCPFSGLNRLPSSFEEGEPPSTAYHDLMGHHTIFTEHTTPPPNSHSCPYIAYFQLQPSSSTSTEPITDAPTFAHHWTGPNEISSSHAFTTVDLHYHTWDHHPPSFTNTTDQASSLRSIRPDSQSGSFVHPFLLGHGSGPRTMVAPPNPSRPHAYHQRSLIYPPGRRSGAPRGMPASTSESGFVVLPPSGRTHPEAENPLRNRFYAWERDRFAPFPLIPVDRESSWWGPFHQGGAEANNRSSSYWQRHGGERTTGQSRAESSSYSSARLHPFI